MFKVKPDYNIYITRGDTGVINFDLENYDLGENDSVVLTVKQNVNTDAIIMQKELDHETKQFIIEPDDTKTLRYGVYVYDIQLTTEIGEVHTVIKPHDFTIESEVTW